MKKTDIIAGIVIGEAIAWLIFLIARHIAYVPEQGKETVPLLKLIASQGALFFLTVGFPLLSLFGLWIAKKLAEKFAVLWQFAKFALVGVLNFLIDLGVYNLLIFLTGITEGVLIPLFGAAGFVTATANSYLWNKFWTFQQLGTKKAGTEFLQFFIVSAVGILINIGVVHLVVNVIGSPSGFNQVLWDNIAKLIGSTVGLIWNFVGYKFFVFRKRPPQETPPAQAHIS